VRRTDLDVWLREQLDEDERVARAAATPGSRWDPARALAEVEAKRRIIDLYEAQSARQYENAMEEDRTWVLESAVRALTLPYADRPGYRPEWAPEQTKGPGQPPCRG
jgi:hypothetical protein